MPFVILLLIVLVLSIANIFIGSVSIPPGQIIEVLTGDCAESATAYIVLKSRIPMVITSILAGASLAISGLMLQTVFRNPLAGPSILGVNSGASLGVALVMLALGGTISTGDMSISGYGAIILGAFVGSVAVMAVLILIGNVVKSTMMLLISGIMIGYITSSVIMILNYMSSADGVQSYVMWGMSSFNALTLQRLPVFALLCLVGITMSSLMSKQLNLLVLGDNYARNLGVNLRLMRNLLLLSTGLLTAVVTACCGPVSFLGLAVPHITRLFLPTDDHRVLVPAVLLTGAAVALLCSLICVLPNGLVLPLNAVTPLIGAPVVIYILMNRRK